MCEQWPSTAKVSCHSIDRRVLKLLVSGIRFVLNGLRRWAPSSPALDGLWGAEGTHRCAWAGAPTEQRRL